MAHHACAGGGARDTRLYSPPFALKVGIAALAAGLWSSLATLALIALPCTVLCPAQRRRAARGQRSPLPRGRGEPAPRVRAVSRRYEKTDSLPVRRLRQLCVELSADQEGQIGEPQPDQEHHDACQ